MTLLSGHRAGKLDPDKSRVICILYISNLTQNLSHIQVPAETRAMNEQIRSLQIQNPDHIGGSPVPEYLHLIIVHRMFNFVEEKHQMAVC